MTYGSFKPSLIFVVVIMTYTTVICTEQSGSAADSSGVIKFDEKDIYGLSYAEREASPLPLEAKCEYLEKHLRKMVANKQADSSSLDRPTLFGIVIESLAGRRVPFSSNREQPYLGPLRDCVEKLQSYQSKTDLMSRTVVASPNYASNAVDEVDPIKSVNNEFAQVKERVADFGQDLYAPKAGVEQYDEMHIGGRVEEHGRDSDYEKQMEQFRREAQASAVNPSSIKNILQEELLDEKSENERDQLKKLQVELALEKDENKRLMQQLEDDKASRDEEHATSESRYEKMKSMYEQTIELEKATSAKLGEAKQRLASLEGAIERGKETNAKLADAMQQLASLREAKSDLMNQYEIARAKNDDDDKVYTEVDEVALKLQDELDPNQTLASKCHKFWLLVNYPSKLNKNVIKTVAKMVFPVINLNRDREFYGNLRYYVDVLSQSQNNRARSIARELDECQPRCCCPNCMYQRQQCRPCY